MNKLIIAAGALFLGSTAAAGPLLAQTTIAEPGPAPGAETMTQMVWPACRPGPGDDRCIQLYEHGVRDAYALWESNSPNGMGGPYEPVDDAAMVAGAAASTAWMAKNPSLPPMTINARGDLDNIAKASWEGLTLAKLKGDWKDGVLTAEEMQNGSAMGSYTGMGGPTEEEGGIYPPCRSRSDDRCQQGS